MTEGVFNRLTKIFARQENLDHADMDKIDDISSKHGVDKFEGRKAFFAGRDLRSLQEGEYLEGGDGSESKKVKPKDLVKVIFNKDLLNKQKAKQK